jgi:hypothetical protein
MKIIKSKVKSLKRILVPSQENSFSFGFSLIFCCFDKTLSTALKTCAKTKLRCEGVPLKGVGVFPKSIDGIDGKPSH